LCIIFFPYTNFFFLIILQHVMLIIGHKQWPKITSIKNCFSQWLYIQIDIICDLVVPYVVTLTWFSLRSSLINKFPKATCNHPRFNNYNFMDSKCHISFPHLHLLPIPRTLASFRWLFNPCKWNKSICKGPSL